MVVRRQALEGELSIGEKVRRAAIAARLWEVSVSCVLSPSLPYSIVYYLNACPDGIVTEFDIRAQHWG